MDDISILIGGAGALGSQIAWLLAGPSRRFVIIDDDRIEDVNLPTTAYYDFHLGAYKAVVLCELLFRRGALPSRPVTDTLRPSNVHRETRGPFVLAVDTFDNVDARALFCGLPYPTLHVGVSEGRTGAIQWDVMYSLPEGFPRGENPVCTHELGRPILRTTAVHAVNVIEGFLATSRKQNLYITESLQTLTP